MFKIQIKVDAVSNTSVGIYWKVTNFFVYLTDCSGVQIFESGDVSFCWTQVNPGTMSCVQKSRKDSYMISYMDSLLSYWKKSVKVVPTWKRGQRQILREQSLLMRKQPKNGSNHPRKHSRSMATAWRWSMLLEDALCCLWIMAIWCWLWKVDLNL